MSAQHTLLDKTRREKRLFFNKFLRGVTVIGSATPSSKWFARTAIRSIDWDRASVIIELGAGTGVITEAILHKARPDSHIIAIEQDPDFVRVLESKFATTRNVDIVQADCYELGNILRARGISHADVIVSGLPILAFPEKKRRELLKVIIRALSPDGIFHQITVFPIPIFSIYRRFFKHVRFTLEPRNIPPGGVYLCREPIHSV